MTKRTFDEFNSDSNENTSPEPKRPATDAEIIANYNPDSPSFLNELLNESLDDVLDGIKMLEDSALNFTNQDLRGHDFSNQNLEEANFSGANLEGTNFEGANLENTNFEGANLKRANFARTRIIFTNFKNADLTDAIFAELPLDVVTEYLADRRNECSITIQDGSILLLDEETVTNIIFSNISTSFEDGHNTKLDHVDFINSEISHCSITNNLEYNHCTFTNSYVPALFKVSGIFNDCSFHNYRHKFANIFENVTFTDTDLTCENAFSDIILDQCTITGQKTRLSRSFLSNTVKGTLTIEDVDLSGFDFSGLDLENIHFRHCTFSNKTTFENADLENVTFEDCDLSGVSFKDANSRKLSFLDCDLDSTNLSSTTDTPSRHQKLTINNIEAHHTANGINFSGSILKNPAFINFYAERGNFQDTTLSALALTNAYFLNGNFQRSTIMSVDWKRSTQPLAQNQIPVNYPFERIRMDEDNINISFRGSNFTEATIKNFHTDQHPEEIFIDFSNVQFINATLKGTSLNDSILAGANFTNADLSFGQISTFTGRNFLGNAPHPPYADNDIPILNGTNMYKLYTMDEEKAFAQERGANFEAVKPPKRVDPKSEGFRQRLEDEKKSQSNSWGKG